MRRLGRPPIAARIRLGAATLVAAVAAGTAARAQQTVAHTLEPVADTYVTDSATGATCGACTILYTKRHSNGNMRAAYRWDFSSIPAGSRFSSASFRLGVGTPQSATVALYRITQSWSEATATWTNTGNGFVYTTTGGASFVANTANTFYFVDVSTMVGAWLSGTSNFGLVLVPTTVQNTEMQSTSREFATVSQRPQLTVNVLPPPALTPVRSSAIVSDPIQGATNPKRIPGAVIAHSLSTENQSTGHTDANTVALVEPVGSGSSLYVGDLGAAGSGPIGFAQGATTSGLTFTWTSLASTTDDVSFSKDGGVTFTYTPVPDGSGYDALVTHVRIAPKGVFAGMATLTSTAYPSFTLSFRTKVS